MTPAQKFSADVPSALMVPLAFVPMNETTSHLPEPVLKAGAAEPLHVTDAGQVTVLEPV